MKVLGQKFCIGTKSSRMKARKFGKNGSKEIRKLANNRNRFIET